VSGLALALSPLLSPSTVCPTRDQKPAQHGAANGTTRSQAFARSYDIARITCLSRDPRYFFDQGGNRVIKCTELTIQPCPFPLSSNGSHSHSWFAASNHSFSVWLTRPRLIINILRTGKRRPSSLPSLFFLLAFTRIRILVSSF
jgi:hypothetical protein